MKEPINPTEEQLLRLFDEVIEQSKNIETWKDITGYEGLYQVSDLGRVKSLSRTIYKVDGTTQTFKDKIIKLCLITKGYEGTGLTKKGNRESVKVHRLVAIAFIDNPENKPQVNHIDGNKLNNCATNLEWNTNIENMKHAVESGLFKNVKGRERLRSILTENEVLEIRSSNLSSRKLGNVYNVNKSTILSIKNRKTWKHI